jgi:hypothetical protein
MAASKSEAAIFISSNQQTITYFHRPTLGL